MSDTLWVTVSSGADSTAMALLLWERGEDFTMLFSDTGAEFPENYWLLPRLMERVNKPLKVVSNGSFFQWLIKYRFLLPSIKQRWCTRILKIEPQEMEYDTGDIVAIGYRADEVHRWEKAVANIKKNKSKYRTEDVEQVAPLVDAGLGKKDVMALCKKYNLLNPVYEWRSNLSCFCCPFQRKGDWLGMLKNHPELYALSEAWEAKSIKRTIMGYTWSHWPLARLRTATQRQLEMWPEQEEHPCGICTT